MYLLGSASDVWNEVSICPVGEHCSFLASIGIASSISSVMTFVFTPSSCLKNIVAFSLLVSVMPCSLFSEKKLKFFFALRVVYIFLNSFAPSFAPSKSMKSSEPLIISVGLGAFIIYRSLISSSLFISPGIHWHGSSGPYFSIMFILLVNHEQQQMAFILLSTAPRYEACAPPPELPITPMFFLSIFTPLILL